MRHIDIIGIGTGNPEHLTIQAINVMNRADVIFIPTKGEGKEELAEFRRSVCRRYLSHGMTRLLEFELPDRKKNDGAYHENVEEWHSAIASIYRDLIADMDENAIGAFLVWGDPGLYDSTLRILERARQAGAVFSVDVVPGISSMQVLTARHAMPLNMIGEAIEITTGRKLAAEGLKSASTVVMLDGEQAFSKIDDPNAKIFWGAYLGTADEITISGALKDVAAEIVEKRAAARARHGWIMDIYLILRGESVGPG